MMVTTCGAAGVLGAFRGAVFFGVGAGVCAWIIAPLNSALTNVTADKNFLTLIALLLSLWAAALKTKNKLKLEL